MCNGVCVCVCVGGGHCPVVWFLVRLFYFNCVLAVCVLAVCVVSICTVSICVVSVCVVSVCVVCFSQYRGLACEL